MRKTTNIFSILPSEEADNNSALSYIEKYAKINDFNKVAIQKHSLVKQVALAAIENKVKEKHNTKRSKEISDAQIRRGSIQPNLPPTDPEKDPEDDEDNGQIKMSENKDILKHIFRNKEGHFPTDTPEARQCLLNLVSDKKNFLGICDEGNRWYGKILSNGKQAWALVRNNIIRNGGVNDIPRTFNSRTGLCQPLLGK